MVKILVAYLSKTGNTKALAEAVVEGVKQADQVTCELIPIKDVTNAMLLDADGIIVGSPTYFGQMAGEVKVMFDRTAVIYGKLEGKVGAAFTTSGGAGCGHELTNMSIINAMLVNGMVVKGTTQGPHYGPFAVGEPGEKDQDKAIAMGKDIAELTLKLHG